jgi:hypothetical protein
VGATPMISLEDDSKQARLCKTQFESLSLEVLRSHPWNFAIKRVSLAVLTEVPAFDFVLQYQLPLDCLRVLKTNLLSTSEFSIEADRLLTDYDAVFIKYISKDVPEGLWDENFAEALSMRMAADFSYSMVQSITLSQHWFLLYKEFMAHARSFDSQEGFSDNQVEADAWINSRF